MTTRRRGTFWATFSEGATATTVVSTAASRLFLLSTREAQVGRQYEGYTVTRMIFNLHLQQLTDVEEAVSCGIILQNADIAVASVEPAADQYADWLWWEEFLPGVSAVGNWNLITRDIRSQRKARGADTELWFYVTNRGGGSIVVHRSGRILCKRA